MRLVITKPKRLHYSKQQKRAMLKHNRLNVGRTALERLVGALNQWQPAAVGGRGSLNVTKKFNSGLQITTLEVNIYHY